MAPGRLPVLAERAPLRSGSAQMGTGTPFAEPQAAKTFTITFATFIPNNYLLAPWYHPQSFCSLLPPARLAFAGDDRGFDPDSPCFRAKQVVTVIPEQADDPDGLLEGSTRNLGGLTESFDPRVALEDGRIDAGEKASRTGIKRCKRGEIPVNTEGMIIEGPNRLGPHTVSVRLRTGAPGGPTNRLIEGSPSIDWDITITIDASGAQPRYRVAGKWDGYPAAELYINRQPVWTYTPKAERLTTSSILKLLPGYADVRLDETGVIH
jgi:hypothetical protein